MKRPETKAEFIYTAVREQMKRVGMLREKIERGEGNRTHLVDALNACFEELNALGRLHSRE